MRNVQKNLSTWRLFLIYFFTNFYSKFLVFKIFCPHFFSFKIFCPNFSYQNFSFQIFFNIFFNCFQFFILALYLGMCTDPRHIELFGVRFEIPAFEPVRTIRTVRTSCLRLLRSTYHGSHRLTRDAWFLYVWPDFLNTSLTRYFK